MEREQTTFRAGFLVVTLALGLGLGGCATVLNGRRTTVPVNSDPMGAQVWVDGELVGRTPLRIEVLGKQTHQVELRLAGHQPRRVTLSPRLEVSYIVLDVILTAATGIVVDLITQAWQVPNPSRIDLGLSPTSDAELRRHGT